MFLSTDISSSASYQQESKWLFKSVPLFGSYLLSWTLFFKLPVETRNKAAITLIEAFYFHLNVCMGKRNQRSTWISILISSLFEVFKSYSSERDRHRTTRRNAELLPTENMGEGWKWEENYCIDCRDTTTENSYYLFLRTQIIQMNNKDKPATILICTDFINITIFWICGILQYVYICVLPYFNATALHYKICLSMCH